MPMLQKGNDANGYVVQQAWTTGRLETTGYEFIGMYTLKKTAEVARKHYVHYHKKQ